MNVGDVIKCVVIAIGVPNYSYLKPIDGEQANIPIIIVENKLRYKDTYKIRITRITPNFMIGEVADGTQ